MTAPTRVIALLVFALPFVARPVAAEDAALAVESAETTAVEAMLSDSDVWQKEGKDGCCDAGCCGCGSSCPLLGLLAPSDACFSDFISPMTNPVFFEDPRTLTEARLIFLNHRVPDELFGGEVRLIALQLRAALTDRLSIVAAKDGYITSSNPVVEDGWADVSIGLKYNLFADCCRQRLLSAGVSYELPVGSTRALQGNGDGEFHLYLTGGTQLGCNWHWLSASGFRLPSDTTQESQVWYWSNHVDRKFGDWLYGFVEVNWYHWMKAGQGPIVGFEGLDLFNFGAQGVAGNDIVTGAVGVKLKPGAWNEIGVAWETPLTDRRDITANRFTFDYILRY